MMAKLCDECPNLRFFPAAFPSKENNLPERTNRGFATTSRRLGSIRTHQAPAGSPPRHCAWHCVILLLNIFLPTLSKSEHRWGRYMELASLMYDE
jgi:hypothetical protein